MHQPNPHAPFEFEVGMPAPALRLPSIVDGSPMSLSRFRGNKLLLHVFASW